MTYQDVGPSALAATALQPEDIPTATAAVYVAKSGSDASDGLSELAPKLTIGAALTAAAALSPSSSNLVVVQVLDAGIYTENLTMADYVSVYAPSSKLVGSITHALNSSIVLAQHDMNGTYGCFLNTAQSGAAYYSAEKVNVLSGFGWANINFGALLVDVKTSIVAAGAYLVQEASGQDGHLHYSGEDVYLDGAATGFYVQATGASIQVRVAHILQLGATTGGTGFLITAGSVVADVQTIGASAAWNVSGGTLDITSQIVTGTKTETGGTVNERLDIESKITFENLNANGDVGTGATQVAQGDHLHAGVYEPEGSVSTHAALTTTHGISAYGATLVDDIDAATARTTLGLGGAATLAVGTTTGTVAAGDDARFLTTAQKADLTDGLDSTAHYHDADRNRANHTGTQAWSTITGTPTTLAGYGITDAATSAQGASADSALQPGDVDDTPVNGVTAAPVSSNWAFDHAAASDPHPGYRLESVAIDLTADVTGALPITNIDIDGGTDIGADLADADLIVVDDGAAAANRKSALSRVWTYIQSKLSSVNLTAFTSTGATSGQVAVADGLNGIAWADQSGGADQNIDGGNASSVYTASQSIDGGFASG